MTIAPSPRGGFLREILLQLRTSWDRAFGYDFFVSYAWKDGQTYADALVDQLSAGRKYRCFLDKHDMGGGAEWRKSVRPALRRSSVLVLVATPLALESDNVFEEIRVFSTLGRPIVPVDVAGGSVGKLNDDHRLYSLLEQRIRRPEQAGDEESQRPSEAMVKFLDSSLGFVRIGRIKSFAQWSLIGIFATLAVLLGVFYLAEKAAKLQAEDRRRTAVAGQLAAQSQLSIGSSADSLEIGRAHV